MLSKVTMKNLTRKFSLGTERRKFSPGINLVINSNGMVFKGKTMTVGYMHVL